MFDWDLATECKSVCVLTFSGAWRSSVNILQLDLRVHLNDLPSQHKKSSVLLIKSAGGIIAIFRNTTENQGNIEPVEDEKVNLVSKNITSNLSIYSGIYRWFKVGCRIVIVYSIWFYLIPLYSDWPSQILVYKRSWDTQ